MSNLAFVFPGQGSQSVGMLNEFAEQYSIVKDTFSEASEQLGFDLWQLVEQGPKERLNQTEFTQPALLTASVALWRAWQQHDGDKIELLAGHSLGEYTALVCAEALEFSDAVKLVHQRGQFMQQAVAPGEGAMAAIIGLPDNQVKQACEQAAENEIVMPANFNSTGQIVIAGDKAAVKRACEIATTLGAKRAIPLVVSVPSHCSLMQSAADKLTDSLQAIKIKSPKISVINNVNVAIETNSQNIKTALIEQLTHPVRWVEIIQSMAEKGITTIVECGPGRVLTGLNKRIDHSLTYTNINVPENFLKMLGESV